MQIYVYKVILRLGMLDNCIKNFLKKESANKAHLYLEI